MTKPLPLDGPGVKVADPRQLLLGYLDWYREALQRKLAGLTDEQLRTPVQPYGWAPLGLVQHLGCVERRWLRWGFAAADVVAYGEGEWAIQTTTAQVWAAYESEVRQGKAAIGDADLETVSKIGGRFLTDADAPPLSRILFHLLQEYARHLGQLDIVRETIDGTTGE